MSLQTILTLRPMNKAVAMCLPAVVLFILFRDGIKSMLLSWEAAEYSHGYLIPIVAAYMAFQVWPRISLRSGDGAWIGVGIVCSSVIALFAGETSALLVITQYSFLLALVGLVVVLVGVGRAIGLWAPLMFLGFMVPLPDFLYNNLSSNLQLISSAIGVAVIRLMGIHRFLGR
jgi:exosortase